LTGIPAKLRETVKGDDNQGLQVKSRRLSGTTVAAAKPSLAGCAIAGVWQNLCCLNYLVAGKTTEKQKICISDLLNIRQWFCSICLNPDM
jgi:hypothetical protein